MAIDRFSCWVRCALYAFALPLAACKGEAEAPGAAAAPLVRIAQVGGATVPDAINATGTVGWRREATLGFTSAGRIAAMRVDEGDIIRPGQLLAALDSTTVAASVSAARAERDRAAAEYARSAKLLEQGWVTRPRVDNARAALLAAEANVRSAGFQLRNAAIVSPGAGVVLARLTDAGQIVAAGTPVLVIGEASQGRVIRLPLADRDAARLRIGALATVRIAAVEGELTGSVIEIGGRAQQATGTFMIEISLPSDARLRAGQIGTVSITVSDRGSTSLAVPPSAVFAPRAGQAFVYVVDPTAKRVKLRRVSIGEASDSAIRVTGGLRPGEWLATSRLDRLADNMAIDPLRTAE
jgi:RND family efflux transporter MFP subunit